MGGAAGPLSWHHGGLGPLGHKVGSGKGRIGLSCVNNVLSFLPHFDFDRVADMVMSASPDNIIARITAGSGLARQFFLFSALPVSKLLLFYIEHLDIVVNVHQQFISTV